MWRLKIGEGGSPLLRTGNGFLGRAVWEFDAAAGSPEERAEVERLRREFTVNRFRTKESRDLLLRMQCAKSIRHSADFSTIVKLEYNEEVTEETILTSLRQALNQYSALQTQDGHWPGDYSGILFIMPLLIFSLHVTGTLDLVISSEHRLEICRYIYNHQNKDGGWGTQVLGQSTMFGSSLNYVTLRLLGEVSEGQNDALAKGRAWILSHGSATAAPQWAKIWLSVIGVYDWSGNKAIVPELWMVPHFLPIHPARFWCFVRTLYMSMAYLYGKKFVGPITPTILEIREELYNRPYGEVDWSKACDSCAKALNMICCWIENPDSDAFMKHLPRIYDYLWLAEDGMKAKVYDGCQTWETALTVQAICSTGLIDYFSLTLEKAYGFLKNSQVIQDLPQNKSFYRHRSRGSWTLSTADNGWSVPDCTGETLQELYKFLRRESQVQRSIPLYVLVTPETCCLSKSVDHLEMAMICNTCNVANQNFGCTTLSEQRRYLRFVRTHKNGFMDRVLVLFIYSIRNGCKFLLSKQHSAGGWGENYLSSETEAYIHSENPHAVNTAWAMLALTYAGQTERDPTPLYRAAKQLIKMQQEEGEFPQQEHVGCFNSSLYFNYPNYRNLFPIWALGEFRRQILAIKDRNVHAL